MKSFIQTGQGNLRTYLTFVFLTGFLALFSLQSASAQVDVNIIVFEVAAPSGGGIVDRIESSVEIHSPRALGAAE